ncbi:MAG: 1,4-dihydroxy-2-naphthoate polyprenyltransferase [Actinobacteria bacterium]|nr:1,4-dihydroxy-2-naphthoate polyprenyltransferase [Actinomycetota bacterium]
MATRAQWIAGTRPRTLPAAIAPVLVGTAIADFEGSARIGIALCALVVALALQVGVNFANDYSDGIRGTDDVRVGPVRLVGQKLATPTQVKRAAFLSFAIAGIAGLIMAAVSGFWILLPVGITAMLAAWFYTGGSKPYGYLGLGEVFVFTYFGLVAVIGTSASQTGNISSLSILGGISCGLLSTAILLANNVRDIPSDLGAGKNTLAVRLGDKKTRALYQFMVVVGIGISTAMSLIENGPTLAWVAISAGFIAVEPIKVIRSGAEGKALIPVLAGTAKTLFVFSLIVSFAIANS